jgi:chemotaxis protein MotA
MAVFAPAFGMLGTLFGLVHMLAGLGNSGLGEIGGTMAFAMITTVYGIIFSNLFFKPLAIKMERRINFQVSQLNVLMEGVSQVYQRRHPTQIYETLEAYYGQHHATLEAKSQLTLVKGM